MNIMVYAVIAEGIICIGILLLLIVQKKKMAELVANLLEKEKKQEEFENQQRGSKCLFMKPNC